MRRERLAHLHASSETKYLEAYDTFKRQVTDIVDVPDGTLDLLFRFLRQNKGA
jgi:hypothetical protein